MITTRMWIFRLEDSRCVVWTKSGKFIGNAAGFQEFAQLRYDITCDLTNQQLKQNTIANVHFANELQRQKSEWR